MLKKLLNKLKGFFSKPQPTPPRPKAGDKVGNITLGYEGIEKDKRFTIDQVAALRQSQLDKHTDFKVGESYRLGGAVVTLHPNKASMLKAIAAVNAHREEKHKKLTERGVDLMLMTPEGFQKLKLDEWLEARQRLGFKTERIMGSSDERYIAPKVLPPKSNEEATKQQFDKIIHDNALDKIKDK